MATLPAWLNASQATVIDPLNNPYFGTATTGEAPVGLGAADGSGILAYASLPGYQAFAPTYGQSMSGDSGMNPNRVDPQAFQNYLSERGYTAYEQFLGDGTGFRYVLDSQGNMVGEPMEYSQDDDAFWTAAMLAAGVTGANIYSSGILGGGAATATGSTAATQTAQTGATAFPVSSGSVVSTPLSTAGTAAPAGGGINFGANAANTLYASPLAGGSTAGAATATAAAPAATGGFGQALASALPNTVGGWGQLASSLYGIYQGNKMMDMAERADPFAPYRPEFAAQLQQLMQNPNMVTGLPGYTATMASAEQALKRNLAAQGLTGSGAAAEALTKFGGEFQNQAFNQYISQLAGLAGAGAMGSQGSMAGTAAGYNTINQSLNNLFKIQPRG